MKKIIIIFLFIFLLMLGLVIAINIANNQYYVNTSSKTQCLSSCRETARQSERDCREQKKNALSNCRLSTDPNCRENVRQQAELCLASANEQQAICEFPCQDTTCCLNDDNCFSSIIKDCRLQGGAVMECLDQEERIRDVTVSNKTNFAPANLSTNGVLTNLSKNVNASGVHLGTYNASHDCDDFADELEIFLTGLGYNATFTAYWCYGGPGNPPAIAHAITDVHLSGGKIVFIEPQTGMFANLDFDGDGIVEVNNGGYTPGQGQGTTDDNCKISVFDNKAAAIAAGAPVD